ncbi:hypothetical protein EWB00_003692, partial [Schistosoma japonicum]
IVLDTPIYLAEFLANSKSLIKMESISEKDRFPHLYIFLPSNVHELVLINDFKCLCTEESYVHESGQEVVLSPSIDPYMDDNWMVISSITDPTYKNARCSYYYSRRPNLSMKLYFNDLTLLGCYLTRYFYDELQMKKEYEKKSKPSILEYLPKCGVTVDLYCPEEMSIDQLLEIFERRGFKSLISHVQTLDHIVNFYYDHLMPKSIREEWTSQLSQSTCCITTTTTTISCSSSSYSGSRNNHLSNENINQRKRNIDNLDNLVITYDVKRFTPSLDASNRNVNCSIQINNTKEIINQSVVNKVSNENIIQNTSLNHSHSNDNTIQPIKKRSKIDRNFSILANNV